MPWCMERAGAAASSFAWIKTFCQDSLFLEGIPELVELCRCGVVNVEEVFHGSRRKVVLQQSALMAIECLVKSLFPTGRKLPRTKKETAIHERS